MKTKTFLWYVFAAVVVAIPLGFHFHWLTDHRQSQSEVAVVDNTATRTDGTEGMTLNGNGTTVDPLTIPDDIFAYSNANDGR